MLHFQNEYMEQLQFKNKELPDNRKMKMKKKKFTNTNQFELDERLVSNRLYDSMDYVEHEILCLQHHF